MEEGSLPCLSVCLGAISVYISESGVCEAEESPFFIQPPSAYILHSCKLLLGRPSLLPHFVGKEAVGIIKYKYASFACNMEVLGRKIQKAQNLQMQLVRHCEKQDAARDGFLV